MKKIYLILLILFGILLVGNLGYLDYYLAVDKMNTGKRLVREEIKLTESPSDSVAAEDCDESCKELITEIVKEEIGQLSFVAGQSGSSPIPRSIPSAFSSQAKVVYIPLITSGSTVSMNWVDIVPSEFYFDLSNYPGAKEVRFEAYLMADQGAAKIFSRIYDATNKREVDFSNIETASNTFTRVESSGMKIWRGNNKYTIQLKSLNGTQAFLQDAKLKIIF